MIAGLIALPILHRILQPGVPLARILVPSAAESNIRLLSECLQPLGAVVREPGW